MAANPAARPRKLIAPAVRWNGTFELTARKFVNRHKWRVCHILPTEDDQLQRAAEVYSRVFARYCRTGRIETVRQFMALYLQSLSNEWHDLATADTKLRETETVAPVEEGLLDSPTPDGNLGPLACDLWSLGQDSEIARAGKALLAAGRDTWDIILDAPSEVARQRVAGRFFRVTDPFYIRVILAYARAYREQPKAAREGYAVFAALILNP